MAPRSVIIEKTATGVPDRAPAASPTDAAGAVERKAAATPYTDSAAVSTQMSVANDAPTTATAPRRPAAMRAGRRPTESTNRPAGPSAIACTTEETVNATAVHVGSR